LAFYKSINLIISGINALEAETDSLKNYQLEKCRQDPKQDPDPH